jgi:hypothetical protein
VEKTFLLISNHDYNFNGVNYPQVEILIGENFSKACENAFIGRGELKYKKSNDEYREGRLTGCMVYDSESETSSIPKFRMIIPDFYEMTNPYEEICHNFNYVAESTVINNPNRFRIGYRSGSILNPNLNGETFRVELSDDFKSQNFNIQLAGKELNHRVGLDQLAPNTRFQIENGTMSVPANYKVVCGKQTNNFVELVEIG